MSRKNLRVYFVTRFDGRLTGTLMRTWSWFFDKPAPAAYGENEEQIYAQLELQLQHMLIADSDVLERYLWDDSFKTRSVKVEIHPQTSINKLPVVGKKKIPLTLTYAWSALRKHDPASPRPSVQVYRVIVPRFGWRLVLEDLETAPEVLRNAVSTMLLGENSKWMYDLRHEGPEFVQPWSPSILLRQSEYRADDARRTFPTLDAVAEEWVAKAARRKLPPVIGDVLDTEQVTPWIESYPPPSLLLVGDPGVGKSTWVRALARMLAQKKRKKDEDPPRIWATSGERIIAGMVYLGMWQKRCLDIIDELSHEGDYLYIDRLTSILGEQPGGSSIVEVLKPAVLGDQISLIAECTESEYERCQRRYASFLGCFKVIRMAEASASAMPQLLAQYQNRLSEVRFHRLGWKRLVQHLDMFQRHTCFPGKGFRFLDWLAQELSGEQARMLYASDASRLFSQFSGLPIALISDDISASPEELTTALNTKVIGQPKACRACARVLARFKAGMNNPERPCASLFFVGPTGVGKTEMAKKMTEAMFGDPKRMIRLDMSEYMLPGSAGRLLQVGDQVTSLAEQVRQQPLSLVLFDEIEKAHPEVFDLLLGVLGEGRMTDMLGREVDFSMSVIIMTSNLGVSETATVGFGGKENGVHFEKVVRNHFRPEFVGRLDYIVPFRNLAPDDVLQIVDLELDKLAERTGLKRRKIRLRVHPQAKASLARLGYHPTRGARPLKRIIEEEVITPIAVRLASETNIQNITMDVVVEGEPAWTQMTASAQASAIVVRR